MIKNKNKDNLPKYPVLATKCCTECKRERPIWKNKVLKGVKHLFCKPCWNKFDASIKKEKREKVREKRRETITEKQLDSIQSKVIRMLYGNKCATCPSELDISKLHSGHVFSRQFRSTRFNPENTASQCPNCNLYLQGAQYEFSKFVEQFHGEGTMEKLSKLSRSKTIKIGLVERRLLFEMYQQALVHQDLQRLIKEYYQIIPNPEK